MATVFKVVNTASEVEWLEARQGVLTATDIGRIVVAPGEVYRIRKEKQQPPVELRSKHIRWGKEREADLVLWGRAFADSRLEHNDQLLVSTRDRRVGATPDMLQPGDTPEIIAEIKTSKHPMPDMDDPSVLKAMSLRYFVQMQVQLFVTGAEACVLIWEQHDDDWQPRPEGKGYRPTIMGVSSQVVVFNPVVWEEVIAPAIELFYTGTQGDPGVDEVRRILADLRGNDMALEMCKRHDQYLRKRLKALVGPGKSVATDYGKVTCSRPGKRTTVDSKALKKDHPEIFAQYSRTVETRPQLRITHFETEE